MDGIQVFDNNGGYIGLIPVDGYPFGLAFNDTGALYVVARDHVVQYQINLPVD
jgi:DNA-binding beta-propeller fold protein YncE